MFFVGILGTYIIYRSGAPQLFAKHGEALSKALAGLNTLVLIFSSLTMALAVDAAAKGLRQRLIVCLALTLACAAGFMFIKYLEYSNKWFHYTMLAKTDSPVSVAAAPNQTLYAVVTSGPETFTGQAFERPPRQARPAGNDPAAAAKAKADYDQARADFWKHSAIALTETSPGSGTYNGTIPAAAAGKVTVKVYARSSAEPQPADKTLSTTGTKPAATVNYDGGIWVYDGHVHDHGESYAFEGYRIPYPVNDRDGVNMNTISEHGVRLVAANAAGVKPEEMKPLEADIPKAWITNKINYGPWKNIFYSCYFALTAVHGVHVLGGMIPISILMIQAARGKIFAHHTEYTGLYWHFVDLVWIFLFPLLYLI
jgi:cytochrome c oxidase subunit 3